MLKTKLEPVVSELGVGFSEQDINKRNQDMHFYFHSISEFSLDPSSVSSTVSGTISGLSSNISVCLTETSQSPSLGLWQLRFVGLAISKWSDGRLEL